MTASFLSALQSDDIMAAREKLEATVRLANGPQARIVPEDLSQEIFQLLYLLELAARQRQDQPQS